MTFYVRAFYTRTYYIKTFFAAPVCNPIIFNLGNPLSCDCNALWLRNWASDEIGPIADEPRCSYPKALSGNPLRMLRTSRFTCDVSRYTFIFLYPFNESLSAELSCLTTNLASNKLRAQQFRNSFVALNGIVKSMFEPTTTCFYVPH